MERPPGPKVTLTTGPQDVANQTHPSTPGLHPSRRGPPPGSSSASNCATLPTRPGRCPPGQGVSVKTRKAERDSGQVAALARSLGRPPVPRSLQFPFVWDSDAQGDQRQEEASCSTIYSGIEAAGTPAAGRPPAHKDERGGREGPDCSRGGVSKATPAGRQFGALPVALPTLALPLPSREENVRATASAGRGEEAARGGKDPAGDQGRGSEGPAPPRAPRQPPGAARGARGTTTRGSPTQSALPPPRARRGPQTEGEYGRTRDARAALTSSPPAPHLPGAPDTVF
ncbi:basic salivary proline-rich protein 4-like [Monodon monoceros]|uniref:basic salivary proline-rich protein 4-like n=1 Tax=Monodon monoceros TaxID=40151 RepID=UPI0010F74E94|nr:basic salivary proline-rich protein 4-like [Monodon monoceros]